MSELNSTTILERLFSAIDVIVDKKLEKVLFNSTIVAEIIKEEAPDKESLCFVLKKQDSEFKAYTLFPIDLKIGDKVSVLIPNGDMNKKKYILGLLTTKEKNIQQTAVKGDYDIDTTELDVLEDLAYGRIVSAQSKIKKLKGEL